MAQTAIEIPEYVTVLDPPLTLPALARVAADLLAAADDLPAPRCVEVSAASQEIEMQFPGDPFTFAAMAQWAERFGGTITGEPGTGKDGAAYVRCEVRFSADGATVKGYAYIRADKAST
ncbi:MAG TPA: hypothetical protein VIX86_00185 [Streptosporangiaceae bacterium]